MRCAKVALLRRGGERRDARSVGRVGVSDRRLRLARTRHVSRIHRALLAPALDTRARCESVGEWLWGGTCWCASESCSERRSSSSPAAVKSSVRCAASAAWSDTWRRASASAARIDSSWERLICSVASDEESASALAREPSAS